MSLCVCFSAPSTRASVLRLLCEQYLFECMHLCQLVVIGKTTVSLLRIINFLFVLVVMYDHVGPMLVFRFHYVCAHRVAFRCCALCIGSQLFSQFYY